jgi:GTP cyclohydrolase II
MAIKSTTIIQTECGPFGVSYHELEGKHCVSFCYGDISQGAPLVRIHSSCLFGEAFYSLHCDCRYQLVETMRQITKVGAGVIVYSYQEGRGVGLEKKIAAMEIQRKTNCDTVDAFMKLGLTEIDYRDYKTEIGALKELGTSQHIGLFSGNPNKRKALEAAGFVIDKDYDIQPNKLDELAIRERKTKIEKMGYDYRN